MKNCPICLKIWEHLHRSMPKESIHNISLPIPSPWKSPSVSPPRVPKPSGRESPRSPDRISRNIEKPPTPVQKQEEAPISSRTRFKRDLAADKPISGRTRLQLANIVTNVTPSSAAGRRYPRNFLLEWAMPVLDEETGKTLEYPQLRKHPKYQQLWKQSYLNELGRLCQGIGSGTKGPRKQRTQGTDTFNIIDYADIPVDRQSEITYNKVVCEVREQGRGPQSYSNHNWRQPHLLPRRRGHPNCWARSREVDYQQCPLPSKCEICMLRHCKLLSHDTNGSSRVCANQNIRHPTRIH
jgi:hypothetical protein